MIYSLRSVLFCLLLLFFLSSAAVAQSASLKVRLSRIQADKGGTLRVALFHSKQNWPKLERALELQRVPAEHDEIDVVFSDLPYAQDYAVEVHHDENGNGKFDMRWLPYPRPKEGVGVSNNSSGFGHPSFDSARFSISQPQQEITIYMRY